MKKIIVLFVIIVLPFFSEARNLWAFLTYSTFSSPEGPYIETYLSVAGNSVIFIKKDNGKFQATVNILMTFSQNNELKAFKKYELNSPEVDDTANINLYFIDEQRYQVPNGAYNFEIQLSDKNKTAKAVPFSQPVTVDFPSDKPSFSGIQLVKSYAKSESVKTITKSGFDLVPYVYNYYPERESRMIFYCELYNIEKVVPTGQKYILNYFIETFENNIKLNEYARMKKETSQPIDVLLSEFNIENLATGNYNLVIEARNQQNEVVASTKLFFQRNNPTAKLSYTDMLAADVTNTFVEKFTNLDTLKEFVSCTFPISTGIERTFIKETLKTATLKNLQEYFYGFWIRRDPVDPEKAWLAYLEMVKKADYNFKTPVKKGYQTDRGYFFLKYGPPNVRSQQYWEPSAYPYEIWQYYTLNNNQRNRKFVFYSPDMVTSDFFLLHSDAIGELYNPSWQIQLQNRVASPLDLQEDIQTINSWGSFSNDYWELPN